MTTKYSSAAIIVNVPSLQHRLQVLDGWTVVELGFASTNVSQTVGSLIQVATMQYVHHFSLCLLHAWVFVPSRHALFLSTVISSLCDPEVAAVEMHEVFRS